MIPKFDYEGAKKEGYSDEEINVFLNNQNKKPSYETINKDDSAFTRIGKNFKDFIGNFGFSIETKEKTPSLEDRINQNLMSKVPNFDVRGALEEGYSPEEINDFLEQQQPKRSFLEQGLRLGAQYGLGLLQGTAGGIAYDVATTPLASKEAQNIPYREMLGDELEQLMEKKAFGQWTDEDQKFYEHIIEQIKDPRKSMEYVQASDLSLRGLAEKGTGIDLHPEGILEKGANWLGFIKNPINWKEIVKLGLKPKELLKAISPSGTEITRSLTAGTALQMAEEGNFGPIGTIASAVVGDLAGFGPKGLMKIVKNPKKMIAETTNLLTKGNNEKEWIRQVISDANEAGIQLDAGTLTNSNLIRWAQARAAQSALSGKALDNFKKDLSEQIVKQYQNTVDKLSNLAFENNYQAADAIRNFVATEEKSLFKQFAGKEAEDGKSLVGRIAVEEQPNYQQELLNRIAPREFENSYQAGETLKTAAEDIKNPIKEEFNQRWSNLNRQVELLPAIPQPELAQQLETFVRQNEGSLLLGESTAENRVLQTARRLRDSLITEDRAFIGVTLNDLIKTKRTLGDIANWEFGGSNFQSAYKQLVGDIDHAIEHTLESMNPKLKNAYEQLNAEYSQFKELFENKNIIPLFEPKNRDYNSLYNSFVKSPDKLRSLEDIMWNHLRGQQLINQIKRDYAQKIIDNPKLTARDLRDLEAVLGSQYKDAIGNFAIAHQQALEQTLPRAAKQPTLGAKIAIPETTKAGKSIVGRTAEKSEHARQKLFEYIKGKSSDQVMQMLDSVDGIRKIKRALSLTQEGKELFDQLVRYKLFEMIDKNMMDSLKENVKLGTFSNLLKSTKSQAIVKELVGQDAFKRLQLLQKNAGRLAASAEKFYNASKSGTTLADVGVVSTLLTGVLTGNPYLALTASSSIGGMKVAGYLLTDATFLKYLEEAILTDSKKKFLEILKKMQPLIQDSLIESGSKSTVGLMDE